MENPGPLYYITPSGPKLHNFRLVFWRCPNAYKPLQHFPDSNGMARHPFPEYWPNGAPRTSSEFIKRGCCWYPPEPLPADRIPGTEDRPSFCGSCTCRSKRSTSVDETEKENQHGRDKDAQPALEAGLTAEERRILDPAIAVPRLRRVDRHIPERRLCAAKATRISSGTLAADLIDKDYY